MHIAPSPLGLALFTHWLGEGVRFRSTMRQLYLGTTPTSFGGSSGGTALIRGDGVLCTFVQETLGLLWPIVLLALLGAIRPNASHRQTLTGWHWA